MIVIPLPLRVPVHILDFGYLVDAQTGEAQRHLGRGTLRVSADFPESCTAHALPGRVAAHVSDLKLALEAGPLRQTALLVLPSYEDVGAGEAAGAYVTVQRILLQPETEPPERPGDSTRASAMVFDWKSFGRLASNILADAGRLLTAEPVTDDLPAARRLKIPRPTVELRARRGRRIADLSPASCSILAAIVDGDCVRLGAEDCCDEPAFLSALADVFEILPEALRGHVSVAAGLTLPDRAVQVAWARCLMSTARKVSIERLFGRAKPDLTLSEAGSVLFGDQSNWAFRPSGVSSAACYSGALISTRTSAGIMPQIRIFVSRLAASRTPVQGFDTPLDYLGVMQTAADLAASRAAPEQRQSLIHFAMNAAPEQRALLARECCRHEDPAITTLAQALCDEPWDGVDLRGLAVTLTLAADAEADPDTRYFGAALALRVRGELAAFLRSKLLFTESMLREIAANDALSAMTADILAKANQSITTRLFDSAAVVELLGPEGRALASNVRQRLVPREGKANSFWRDRTSDTSDRARALSLLISAEPIDAHGASLNALALAARFMQDGRRDLVVDTMRAISARLSLCETPGNPADALVERRRLDVLIALASTLRQISNVDSADKGAEALRAGRPDRSSRP